MKLEHKKGAIYFSKDFWDWKNGVGVSGWGRERRVRDEKGKKVHIECMG